ncbi:MFS general substrate transporter [Aureobasidium subglaciale]|nr:MFS general substrate transporter [Aureobasidium subglaciale]
MSRSDSPVAETEPLLNSKPPRKPQARKVILLIALIAAISSISGSFIALPFTRLVESAICQQYYESAPDRGGELLLARDVDEADCKIDVIQARLAYVLAIQEILEAVSGFAFALPYGLLADRIGRTKVLTLSFFGIFLSGCWAGLVVWQRHIFPIWTIWFISAFQIVGGGQGIPMTMIYTMIADVQTEAERTNTLFYILVCAMVTELVASSLTATLMSISPWVPFCIGVSVIGIVTLIAMAIPETRPSIASSETTSEHIPISQHVRQIVRMFTSRSLCLIFLSFIGEQVILKNSFFAARYISKRFSWPLSRYGYFMSARTLLAILLYVLILPQTSRYLLSRLHYTPLRKDLTMARSTAIILAIGLLLAAGPSLPLVLTGLLFTTIGASSTIICRSMAVQFVDPAHIASMYTLLNLLNFAGAIVASPLLAGTFVLGMKWGGVWQGLPYMCLGALGVVSAIALGFVDGGDGKTEHDEDGDEEQGNEG